MYKYIIITILTFLFFTGCSRWIAPPYTNVDNISDIEIGMSLQQVNDVLEIKPYDVYFKGDDDYIVIYNYRVKDRILKISGNYEDMTHSELSQTSGAEWYGQKYFCYVYFKDSRVKSIVTDEGKRKSEDILIKNNNIFLIQKEQVGFYSKNDSIFFVPMHD